MNFRNHRPNWRSHSLRATSTVPLRGGGKCKGGVMVKVCWDECPEKRPAFSSIKKLLQETGPRGWVDVQQTFSPNDLTIRIFKNYMTVVGSVWLPSSPPPSLPPSYTHSVPPICKHCATRWLKQSGKFSLYLINDTKSIRPNLVLSFPSFVPFQIPLSGEFWHGFRVFFNPAFQGLWLVHWDWTLGTTSIHQTRSRCWLKLFMPLKQFSPQ